jgi:UDP-GlcNAc:undecaprenyl-phosphate GlcNAc-1-phosphate transferase
VVNLIDGLDGLAAGVSAIASITVILVAVQQGVFPVAILTAALAGGIIGFIRYNFNPASIFMGDTGSMFIGYMLAAISIFGAVKSAATIALIVPAVALGLPIMDTAFAILRRYTNGRPIFQPDKGHLHHRLLAMGMSQRQAVLFMYAISATLSVAAVVLTEVDGYFAAVVIAIIVTCVAIGAKKIGILNDR